MQEEELDDLAGQVQMLEQAKTKLEMSIAAMKKEHRRELSAKEDDLEDARAAAQKKIKALEQQLESEHEERIHFVREKHELETKIMNLQVSTYIFFLLTEALGLFRQRVSENVVFNYRTWRRAAPTRSRWPS